MWIHALAHVITITLQFFFSSPLLVMLSETVYLFPHLFLVTRQHRKVCKCLCVCVFEKKKNTAELVCQQRKRFLAFGSVESSVAVFTFLSIDTCAQSNHNQAAFLCPGKSTFLFFKNAIFFPPATIVSCKCFLKCYVLLLQYFWLLYFFVYGRI